MAGLIQVKDVLDLDDVNPRVGVKFSSAGYQASAVIVHVARWIDMGRPRQITVTLEPVPSREPLVR